MKLTKLQKLNNQDADGNFLNLEPKKYEDLEKEILELKNKLETLQKEYDELEEEHDTMKANYY